MDSILDKKPIKVVFNTFLQDGFTLNIFNSGIN